MNNFIPNWTSVHRRILIKKSRLNDKKNLGSKSNSFKLFAWAVVPRREIEKRVVVYFIKKAVKWQLNNIVIRTLLGLWKKMPHFSGKRQILAQFVKKCLLIMQRRPKPRVSMHYLSFEANLTNKFKYLKSSGKIRCFKIGRIIEFCRIVLSTRYLNMLFKLSSNDRL